MDRVVLGDIIKLKQFSFFEQISIEKLQMLFEGASVKKLKHREYLYRAGELAETFCVVVEGVVKLIRHSPKGEDIIVHFAGTGEIIGGLLMNQGDQAVYPISAKVMGPTQIFCVPKSVFKKHWKNDVEIQSSLNSALYRRMSNIQDDKAMSTSPLKIRIASVLLRHLDTDSASETQPLSIVLTRQEIADTLGVAVESVIRTMRELLAEGIIQKSADKGPEQVDIRKLIDLLGR